MKTPLPIRLFLTGLACLVIWRWQDNWNRWASNPDEGIYWAMAASGSFQNLWDSLFHRGHPPFYYVFTWLVGRVTVDLDILRSLSTLSVLGCIPMGWVLFRRWLPPLAAGFGLLLVVASPEVLDQAFLLRQYGFLILVLLAAWYAMERFGETARKRWLVASSGLWFLAVATHYAAALLIPGAFVAWALSRHRADATRKWQLVTLGLTAAGAAVIPLTFLSDQSLRNTTGTGADSAWLSSFHLTGLADLSELTDQLLKGFLGAEAVPGIHEAALLLGVVLAFRLGHHRLFWMATLSTAIVIVASRFALYPYGSPRHDLFLVLLWAPTIALGPAWMLGRDRPVLTRVLGGGLGLLLVSGLTHPVDRMPRERIVHRVLMSEFVQWSLQEPESRVILMDHQTFNMVRCDLDLRRGPGRTGQPVDFFKHRNMTCGHINQWFVDDPGDDVIQLVAAKFPDRDIWHVTAGWGYASPLARRQVNPARHPRRP